ncbi:response regulator [Microbacterium sp. P07]|uniref:response regulator transcription factor n=1 Tax=Microbacterium sp. P07 TaxID=3366952 RepID=UPI003744C171
MTVERTRVVVVDDQPIVSAGLKMMIDAEADMEVVATAGDGAAAVEICRRSTPDVVLMDIRMPVMDGIEATRRILAQGYASAVLMITTFGDEEYVFESMRAGASGFILKDAGADLIAAALRSAVRGDALIDPSLTRALLARHARTHLTGVPSGDVASQLSALSPREREVLAAVAQGWSNREIAARLTVTDATVKTHLSNLMPKIGARSRAAAAAFAYESGFLRPSWMDD